MSAFLIKGPKNTLVDCGYSSSYENVLSGLAEVGVMPSDIRYVVPTHVHLDHAGAAGRLLREMPNAQVIAHERGVPHLIDPTRLIESSTKVFGKAIMDLYGTPEPIPAERITSVGNEASLDLGDGLSATLIYAPGHAPHQISMMLDKSKALLTADAVGIVYPGMKALIPTTPPPSFDPKQLVATVGALRQTTPSELLVPHFGVRKDVEWVFDETVQLVESWVETVRGLWKRGMSLDEASEIMEKEIIEEARVRELPIYASISVRTSVMGIIHYLEKTHE
ncbi:MAG TPA: MBL fold metallo-hydrolase [Nitrososphaerales archaeon]|nr:MBL fold metallo-hydrolase [Nitrososphaerales archaeon]